MAGKQPDVKATAKRAAGKRKPRAKAAPRVKAARSAAKPAAKPTAKPTARQKPAARRTRKGKARAAAPDALLLDELAPASEATPRPARKGALARLAGGVGSLLARVTGKKAPAPDQTPDPSLDRTIELTTGDILSVTAAPRRATKSKR